MALSDFAAKSAKARKSRTGLLTVMACIVRGARRSEFDPGRVVWSIPAGRMKMRVLHDVPLSKQAIAIIKNI